jgi:hypothetical protein
LREAETGVCIVIVAGEVEQAVEHKDLELCSKRVAACSALAARGFDTDGNIARDFFLALEHVCGRERKNVRGLVFASETAVEVAESRVGGEQDGDLAAETDGGLGFGQKAGQSACRGQAEIARFGSRNRPIRRFRRKAIRCGVGTPADRPSSVG